MNISDIIYTFLFGTTEHVQMAAAWAALIPAAISLYSMISGSQEKKNASESYRRYGTQMLNQQQSLASQFASDANTPFLDT